MSTFFHTWQRKTGCVTLALATVFAMIWVRSFNVDQYGYGDYLILGASMYDCSVIRSRSGMVEFAHPQRANDISYYCRFPHMVVVIPLTLLSACFLLNKTGPDQQSSAMTRSSPSSTT